MNETKNLLARGVQAFLSVEFLWHVGEFALALYEQAWLPSTALGIHAAVVGIAVYLLGHDHMDGHVHDAHEEGLFPLRTNSKKQNGDENE